MIVPLKPMVPLLSVSCYEDQFTRSDFVHHKELTNIP